MTALTQAAIPRIQYLIDARRSRSNFGACPMSLYVVAGYAEIHISSRVYHKPSPPFILAFTAQPIVTAVACQLPLRQSSFDGTVEAVVK